MEDVQKGIPILYLPIYNWMLLDYSREITEYINLRGFELSAKND